jgi:hypothetical protein
VSQVGWSRRFLLAVLVPVLALAAAPAAEADPLALNPTQAAACPSCVTDEGGARVVNFFMNVAGQTGKTVTYSGPTSGFNYAVDASATFSDFAGLEASAGATTATTDVLAGVTAAAETSAVLPPVAGAASFALPAVGAFLGGFAIGTAGKWVVGKLFGGTGTTSSGAFTSPSLTLRTAGTQPRVSGSAVTWNGAAPARPYYQFSVYNSSASTTVYSSCSSAGNPGPFVFDTMASAVSPTTSVLTGSETCGNSQSGTAKAYILSPDDMLREGLKSTTTAPSGYRTLNPIPTVPSRQSVADGVAQALNSRMTTDAAAWLQHELDPRCSPDPTNDTVLVPTIQEDETAPSFEECLERLRLVAVEKVMPETDLDVADGAPATTNPVAGSTVHAGTEVKVYVNPSGPEVTSRRDESCRPADAPAPSDPGAAPPGYVGSDPAFTFRPAPAPEGYPGKDWSLVPAEPTTVLLHWGTESWGYRHIMRRRGYGAQDELDTMAALEDPTPTREDDEGRSWVFHLFYSVGAGGEVVPCVRGVVVNFWRHPQEDVARHIISSWYGIDLR